ncbi:MAG: PhnD/SsuA/transferrin family substrate-binding protein [Acidobacteria bacterium]|nr:PhnD/SsuA/transferrin family substrate-binding protein [Acidobacteriota bacterium]
MASRCASWGLVALAVGLVLGCVQQEGPGDPGPRKRRPGARMPVYRFAVHPLHNPSKLSQAYQPLLDYLNRHQREVHLTLEASRDYASFEDKYKKGKPEFLLPNPWQTLRAIEAGYRVIAMAGEAADFKGLLVARRDSGLRHPADLKGKRVSYPARTALAACIMPQSFLHSHGINVTKDLENKYVGSQESAIMNVYLRLTDAGATWPPPWRAFQREHPEEARDLVVLWETEPLLNNSVMVRRDVPGARVEEIQALLLALNGNDEGRAILAGMETARFLPAADGDYDAVRDYVARFEREVRPVEER